MIAKRIKQVSEELLNHVGNKLTHMAVEAPIVKHIKDTNDEKNDIYHSGKSQKKNMLKLPRLQKENTTLLWITSAQAN
ncbi:hypothetical protein [Bacteroides sp. Marseille-P3684]|uniref:hypothetical protein n=1 Tax=Bacteroides sp. Marseille-P3684 TaxID=2086579 RepID=UPI000D0BB343|nr:hypothetical protein [Bacteroides sp. Marseille-P3684]